MRRLKHHCKRLKTFSTTPESRFRDQGVGGSNPLSPTIQFFPTLSHCKRWFKNLRTEQESSKVVCSGRPIRFNRLHFRRPLELSPWCRFCGCPKLSVRLYNG